MRKIMAAVITGILFIAEIILLKVYDVAPIGAGGTYVGFSGINGKVHEMLGEHMNWYEITEYIGYAALAICAFFALVGLYQLISRRRLRRVDREILSLGGLFAADIIFYVLFEKFIVNYRPIFIDGSTEPEASFPSSHTVLIVTVMLAIVIISEHYVRESLAILINIICVLVAMFTVAGRLYSGAHWLTDIIGGILLSATLLFVFDAVIEAGEYDAEGFYEPDEDDFYEDDEEEEAEEEYDEEYDDDYDGEYPEDDDESEYGVENDERDFYEGKIYEEEGSVYVEPGAYEDPEETDFSAQYEVEERESDAMSLADLFEEDAHSDVDYEGEEFADWLNDDAPDIDGYDSMEGSGGEEGAGYSPRH